MSKTSFVNYSAEDFAYISKELKRAVDTLDVIVATMKIDQIASVSMRHTAELKRGMKYIPKFAAFGAEQVREAVISKQHQTGRTSMAVEDDDLEDENGSELEPDEEASEAAETTPEKRRKKK